MKKITNFHFKWLALCFIVSGSVFADRTIYFASTAILCGAVDAQGYGLNVTIYNPSQIALQVTVRSQVVIAGDTGNLQTEDWEEVSRTIPPGSSLSFANGFNTRYRTLGHPNAMISVSGSITVTGDNGFVVANGSQWTAACDGATPGNSYSMSFSINEGKPF